MGISILKSRQISHKQSYQGFLKNDTMSLEQKINYQLNKYPGIKKVIKRGYQLIMYTISPRIKSDGNIIRISPNESGEYFFGYYDNSAMNICIYHIDMI